MGFYGDELIFLSQINFKKSILALWLELMFLHTDKKVEVWCFANKNNRLEREIRQLLE